jgi:tetratricopeptide (TPR) repeat protein
MVVMEGISIMEGDEWVLHGLGILYADQGRLSDAEAMYERALRGFEKALRPEHTSTLNAVNNLGNLTEETKIHRITSLRRELGNACLRALIHSDAMIWRASWILG